MESQSQQLPACGQKYLKYQTALYSLLVIFRSLDTNK